MSYPFSPDSAGESLARSEAAALPRGDDAGLSCPIAAVEIIGPALLRRGLGALLREGFPGPARPQEKVPLPAEPEPPPPLVRLIWRDCLRLAFSSSLVEPGALACGKHGNKNSANDGSSNAATHVSLLPTVWIVPEPVTEAVSLLVQQEMARGLRCGVSVFVSQEAESAELRQAIHAATQGQPFCSSSLLCLLYLALQQSAQPPEAAPPTQSQPPQPHSSAGPESSRNAAGDAAKDGAGTTLALLPLPLPLRLLTRREREVSDLAATGLSNAEIGARLCIDITTVKSHLTHVFRKVGIRSRKSLRSSPPEPGCSGSANIASEAESSG